MTFTKPMLAAPLLPPEVEHTDEVIYEEMRKLRYPVGATLKKDGIRALRLNGTLLSRRLKTIPNKALCGEGALILPPGFDMELWNKELEYCQIESIVMSRVHADWQKIQFHVLDWYGAAQSYGERCDKLCRYMMTIEPALHSRIKFSPPVMCDNAEQLFAFFRMCEEEAGEGICFRTFVSPYKHGRSTLKEQFLVKLCRMATSEAMIIGFAEQECNGNPDSRDKTGMMDRSSCAGNKFGKNTLGSLMVRDSETGHEFWIGTGVGLDDRLRAKIWDNQNDYLGRTIVYKCKRHGEKVKPRSPVFKGFRDVEIDS